MELGFVEVRVTVQQGFVQSLQLTLTKEAELASCCLILFELIRGRARTQVPTTRNYTLELPTFGVIAGVNPIEVQ